MAGYTAVARIEHVDVHVARASRVPTATAATEAQPMTEEPGGTSLTTELGELVARIREQWAITTFYLFDPESWR